MSDLQCYPFNHNLIKDFVDIFIYIVGNKSAKKPRECTLARRVILSLLAFESTLSVPLMDMCTV